eukprot:GHVU01097135.1.p1 GENE.GHVU01097135.1~~GHVU01097135.1.p1  ORF type:complete len:123 (-),score=15.06 GHVU01097135.1:548-916(-)
MTAEGRLKRRRPETSAAQRSLPPPLSSSSFLPLPSLPFPSPTSSSSSCSLRAPRWCLSHHLPSLSISHLSASAVRVDSRLSTVPPLTAAAVSECTLTRVAVHPCLVSSRIFIDGCQYWWLDG